MKIVCITDTHFGIKNDSVIFHEYQKKCFNEFILPEIKRRSIDRIVHLGDVFDKRKQINFGTFSFVRENFFDHLIDYEIDIIIGNHDCYYKNTNFRNSPSLLLEHYSNINIYDECFEKDDMLYVPWLNSENSQKTINNIFSSKMKYCLGHLPINGYVMHQGYLCEDGISSDIFSAFDLVLSGHFHTKNFNKNIHYLGCPWDLIATDVNDFKGIHFFDTETGELEFCENPYKIFHRLTYNDYESDLEHILLSDEKYSQMKNAYVKVFIDHKQNPVLFDKYCERLKQAEPSSIVYIENDFQDTNTYNINLSEDTLTTIRNTVHSNQFQIAAEKKTSLENLLTDLYMNALNI